MLTKTEDTIQRVAFEQLGSVENYRDILDANLDLNVFEDLRPGLNIQIPSIKEVQGAVITAIEAELDLSSIKQEQTANPHQLISWLL